MKKWDKVQEILENKKDQPNVINKGEWSALHWICWSGDIKILETLLKDSTFQNKMNFYKEDSNGKTPISLAVQFEHFEIIKLLINQNWISLRKKDNSGKSLCDYFKERKLFEIVFMIQGFDTG